MKKKDPETYTVSLPNAARPALEELCDQDNRGPGKEVAFLIEREMRRRDRRDEKARNGAR